MEYITSKEIKNLGVVSRQLLNPDNSENRTVPDFILVEPCEQHREPVMQYRQEFIDRGEGHIHGSFGLNRYESYDEWLDMIRKLKRKETSPFEVSTTTYLFVRQTDGRIIGNVQLRHELSNMLKRCGGHIGYSIRPSERRKGYAVQQLQLVIEEARKRNLPQVMLTCDPSNIASQKTILRCSGVLEQEVYDEVEQEMVQKYWIKI